MIYVGLVYQKSHISTWLLVEEEYKHYAQWEFFCNKIFYHIHYTDLKSKKLSYSTFYSTNLFVPPYILIHQLDQPVLETKPTHHIDVTCVNMGTVITSEKLTKLFLHTSDLKLLWKIF